MGVNLRGILLKRRQKCRYLTKIDVFVRLNTLSEARFVQRSVWHAYDLDS